MAGIVDAVKQSTEPSGDLAKLADHPMFTELQATLSSECQEATVPYTLVQGDGDMTAKDEPVDFVVEDAILQAEFRQLAPLGCPQVAELENFYQTQSASIITQRTDTISKLHSSGLDEERMQQELIAVGEYYDRQQEHLTLRVSRSLQLLKVALPNDISPPSGNTKNKKSRLLDGKAVAIMNDWYQKHIDHPYPTDDEKQDMADLGRISLSQVKAWFANKRNRSLNTKPKRQKFRMQQQLSSICEQLVTRDGGKSGGNYQVLMQDLSTIVTDRSNIFTNCAFREMPSQNAGQA